MKKILSLIIALAMITSMSAVFSEEPDEIILISEETPVFEEYAFVEGTVKSVSGEQIELDDFVLNIGEATLICDTELIPVEIKEGDLVVAYVSSMTTRSLPPQAYAYYVIVKKNVEDAAPLFARVSQVKDGFIYSTNDNYEISYENAELSMYKTKNIITAEELSEGTEIFFYADIMTMSIPALVNPAKIVVMPAYQADETDIPDEIQEPAAEYEYISDTQVIEGTVKSVSEEQIELDDFVLNIDANTLICNTELIPDNIKEGDLITAIASSMTTRSLPPQAYAFYVVVRNDEETAPLYMTVDTVEDGFIYTQNGNYKVSFENSEVGMYRTKNIVKAEELTKGSEIFVYADVMTMSIPALVNPSKIVVMSIAEKSKAELLHQQGILLGTEDGLELEREVTRAEAVTLIKRTTMSDKMLYVSDFADVDKTHWAYADISWAFEKNIVAGVGNNKFEPDRQVTAKELCMMLLNAMGEEVEFEQAFEISKEKGLVTEQDGIEESDVLDRENTAKIIYNYINK